MATTNKIKDGWYLVWPDGGTYNAVRIVDGEIDDILPQSLAGSDRAGNPPAARIHDAIDAMCGEDADCKTLEDDEHISICNLLDPDMDPLSCHVSRIEL